ncbi:MAG TPA: hypothetical protein VF678_10850, partial [bacterium]
TILVQNGDSTQRASDGFALVQGPWRLLDHPRGAETHIQLYNLAKDPEETEDLWSTADAATREKWRKTLAEFPLSSRRAMRSLASDLGQPHAVSK